MGLQWFVLSIPVLLAGIFLLLLRVRMRRGHTFANSWAVCLGISAGFVTLILTIIACTAGVGFVDTWIIYPGPAGGSFIAITVLQVGIIAFIFTLAWLDARPTPHQEEGESEPNGES